MDLSIIIVNWKSKDYLNKCIASILAYTTNIEYEIIVIDSASFDGCGEMLENNYPDVQFIQSNQNNGFAISNNDAFRKANGRVLLFLNPDTQISDNSIVSLYKEIESIDDAGIIGPTLINEDGSFQKTCVRSFPTILNQVLDIDILRNYFPSLNLSGINPICLKDYRPFKVEAISGACLMIKANVFKQIGMFSTDYFMYSEDIDLCYKAFKKAWRTYFLPSAIIKHFGGGSSTTNELSTSLNVIMLESRYRYFKKNITEIYSNFYKISMFFVSILRLVVIGLIWPVLSKKLKSYKIRELIDKWVARLKWSINFEDQEKG